MAPGVSMGLFIFSGRVFCAADDDALKHLFILLRCKQLQSELVYLQTKMFREKTFLGRHSKSRE